MTMLAFALLSMFQTGHAPAIARAAGFTVGKTTTDGYERRHGKGRPYTGGHPQGGREWYDLTTHTDIRADGFYYWRGTHEVVDILTIEWTPYREVDSKVPKIRLRRSELGMLGKVRSGMKPAQIESALHLRLVAGKATLKGLIKYARTLGNKNENSDRFTTWTATFEFDERSGLREIRISAE